MSSAGGMRAMKAAASPNKRFMKYVAATMRLQAYDKEAKSGG